MARAFFQPNKSFIIIGGLGGFALELVHWMVTRGARNLILTSRSGVKDVHQSYCIKRLEQYGAKVVVSTLDAGDSRATDDLLNEANRLGPVGGIFNLTVVSGDKLFINQTEQSFTESAHCRVIATINLDKASRLKCPHLDHFVVFSTVISSLGGAGQCNHGLVNSAMERICEERRKLDLPGLAIQWGAIADMISMDSVMTRTAPQKINSCIIALDKILACNEPIVTSCVRLIKDTDSEAAYGAPAQDLVSIVCQILGLSDLSSISPAASLQELGMDSLMIVELKQALDRGFDTAMTSEDIRSLTLEKLRWMSEQDRSAESD